MSNRSREVNEFVSAFAKACGEKVIGFASVDPNSPTAVPDLERAVKELGLRGLKLSPIYQDFEPDSPEVYPLYETIQELSIPKFDTDNLRLALEFRRGLNG